jgi:hypothetical protein
MLFGTLGIGFTAGWLLKLPKPKKAQPDEKRRRK